MKHFFKTLYKNYIRYPDKPIRRTFWSICSQVIPSNKLCDKLFYKIGQILGI